MAGATHARHAIASPLRGLQARPDDLLLCLSARHSRVGQAWMPSAEDERPDKRAGILAEGGFSSFHLANVVGPGMAWVESNAIW